MEPCFTPSGELPLKCALIADVDFSCIFSLSSADRTGVQSCDENAIGDGKNYSAGLNISSHPLRIEDAEMWSTLMDIVNS